MILLLEAMPSNNESENSNAEGTRNKLNARGIKSKRARRYAREARRRSRSPPKQKSEEFAPGLVEQLGELNKGPFLRSENLPPNQIEMASATPALPAYSNKPTVSNPLGVANGALAGAGNTSALNSYNATRSAMEAEQSNNFIGPNRSGYTLSAPTAPVKGEITRFSGAAPESATVAGQKNLETRARQTLGFSGALRSNNTNSMNPTETGLNANGTNMHNQNNNAFKESFGETPLNLGGSNLEYEPLKANSANAFTFNGENSNKAAEIRRKQMMSSNPNWAAGGKSLGQIANSANSQRNANKALKVPKMHADFDAKVTIDVDDAGLVSVLMRDTKKSSGFSMGLTLPSMGMPGLPSTKGLSNSLKAGLGAAGAAASAGYAAILAKLGNVKFTLPNGSMTLPNGKDVTELVSKLLARLPNGAKLAEMISLKGLSGLKLGLKDGLPAISLLFDQNFHFLTNFRRLGILITLSQWFDNQPDPTIRSISADLKKYENDARDCVKRTVALASTLQSMGGRDGKFSKNNVAALLGSLRADIATLNELKAELNKTLKTTLGESVSFKEAANQDELEKVLDTLSIGYDAMATSELKQVTVQNAADFKKIVENFKEMVAIPQKMLDGIKDITDPDAFFKKLLEVGRAARGIMAKTGYNISRAASNVGSSVSRGLGSLRNRFTSKTSANNNGTKKNNRPWWRRGLNKVKGAYGTLKNRLFKKKNVPSVASEPLFSGTSYTQGPMAAGAARTRTRKNRRHH